MTTGIGGEHNQMSLPVPGGIGGSRRRPSRRRRSALARAVAAVVVPLAAVGCVGSGGESVAGPVLRSEAVDQANVAGAAADAANEPWTTSLPGGPELTGAATAEEIRVAVAESHGRTLDVAAEMRRFAPFPDLPPLGRADVQEIRADIRAGADATVVVAVAEVVYSADGSLDEIVERFGADFTDRGWVRLETRTAMAGGGPVRLVDFEIPDSAYSLPDIGLTVTAAPSFDGAVRSEVRVRYTEQRPADDPVATRYQAWADGVPLPAGSVVTAAGIHASSVGGPTLHYSLAMFYPDTTPGELATSVRAALPAGGFVEDPRPPSDDATDDWVHLNSERFETSWISSQGPEQPGTGLPTRVNVDARVAFEASTP